MAAVSKAPGVGQGSQPPANTNESAENARKRGREESPEELERTVKPKNKEETPVEPFARFLEAGTITILSFPQPKILLSVQKLVESNLKVIAQLTENQKLAFSDSGIITSRPKAGVMAALWYNNYLVKDNPISNLIAFNQFVRFYYNNDPVNRELIPREELKAAVAGLEILRQTYIADYGEENDDEEHVEIIDKCIKSFVKLSNTETTIDGFLRSIYSKYSMLRNEPQIKLGSSTIKIIKFSHLIEPFIEHLRKPNNGSEELISVVEFLKFNDGLFQKKYFSLIFACFFASYFLGKDAIDEARIPLGQIKLTLNYFCQKLLMSRTNNSTDTQIDADRKALKAEKQQLFLEILGEKERFASKKEPSRYSFYAGIARITLAVAAIALPTSYVPSFILALLTRNAMEEVAKLLTQAKAKLSDTEIQELQNSIELVQKYIKDKNGNLDEIIKQMTTDIDELNKRGDTIKDALLLMRSAKGSLNQ